MSRFWVVVLLVLGLSSASAEAASALTWRAQRLGQPHGGLLAVSCVSSSFCVAVGSIERRNQGVTLAEVYDGARWAVMPTADVPGTTDSELLGVSCSSQTACMAVGFSQDTQGVTSTLAERWNGVGWSLQPTPGVPSSGLAAVSCWAPTACTAVGGSGSFPNAIGSALAERWDGTAWSLEPTPALPSGSAEALRGVSCVGPGACAAVGEEYGSAGTAFYGVVLRWNGATWSTELRYGDRRDDYGFNAVSCRSARSCVAVGQNLVPSGGEYGMWARTRHGRWSTPHSNIVADNQQLDGVACTSSRACVAVGGIHESRAYGERWNGSSWSYGQISASVNIGVNAVSCTSSSRCVAVGVFQRASKPTYPVVAVSS
jgi:hypothetical protein